MTDQFQSHDISTDIADAIHQIKDASFKLVELERSIVHHPLCGCDDDTKQTLVDGLKSIVSSAQNAIRDLGIDNEIVVEAGGQWIDDVFEEDIPQSFTGHSEAFAPINEVPIMPCEWHEEHGKTQLTFHTILGVSLLAYTYQGEGEQYEPIQAYSLGISEVSVATETVYMGLLTLKSGYTLNDIKHRDKIRKLVIMWRDVDGRYLELALPQVKISGRHEPFNGKEVIAFTSSSNDGPPHVKSKIRLGTEVLMRKMYDRL